MTSPYNPIAYNPIDSYCSYLQSHQVDLPDEKLSQLKRNLEQVNWDAPTSSVDLNNVAVLTLIEAEKTTDLNLRELQLESAIAALEQAQEIEYYPLCNAHLACIYLLIRDTSEAYSIAFSSLLSSFQAAFNSPQRLPLGLIYIPPNQKDWAIARGEKLRLLLEANDSYEQTLILLAEALTQIPIVFYDRTALRYLQFLAQLVPNSAFTHLKCGLANLLQKQWEGLFHLQKAAQLSPNSAPILQALFLAYRDPAQPHQGDFWLKKARALTPPPNSSPDQNDKPLSPLPAPWQWTTLSSQHSYTYVPYDDRLLLAVNASVNSIVTAVLLAEGDWFEPEMELWRDRLEPGMTVIDVGANVGVYAFSAANRVGETGRVLAIEPFSGCVTCLEETRRVNQLDWVTICRGAASDQNGTIYLELHGASELNEVVDAPAEAESDQYESVSRFTLDSLMEEHQLDRVDWIKLDAEGHELKVLQGGDRLLTRFAPAILYENVAGGKLNDPNSSNTSVAQYLLDRGYQLFRYRPFLKTLIPIESIETLVGNLNIVALPTFRPNLTS